NPRAKPRQVLQWHAASCDDAPAARKVLLDPGPSDREESKNRWRSQRSAGRTLQDRSIRATRPYSSWHFYTTGGTSKKSNAQCHRTQIPGEVNTTRRRSTQCPLRVKRVRAPSQRRCRVAALAACVSFSAPSAAFRRGYSP